MSASRLSKETVVALTTSGISLVVGTLVGHIWTKRSLTGKYESLISEEIAKAKAFYSQRNKTGDYADPVALAEELIGEDLETEEVDEDSIEPDDSFFDDEGDDDYIIVEGKPFREMIDPEDRVNYNKISEDYRGPVMEREKHVEKPPQIEDGESMEEYERRLMEAAHDQVQAVIDEVESETGHLREEDSVVSNIFDTNSVDAIKVSGDAVRTPGRPYIITVTEFTDNELGYGQNAISYYAGDHVLADERDQPIPNIDGVVGERNLRFGDGSGDANVVFVRNEALQVDFEICQSLGTYAEEVLGVAPKEDRRKRPR
ncbi:hypothetical protein SEA_CONLEY_59 [Gordonia phage Conley]|nr:hypothetical protein SEA_CONLEY_59 [Gordonia phage Conley]